MSCGATAPRRFWLDGHRRASSSSELRSRSLAPPRPRSASPAPNCGDSQCCLRAPSRRPCTRLEERLLPEGIRFLTAVVCEAQLKSGQPLALEYLVMTNALLPRT